MIFHYGNKRIKSLASTINYKINRMAEDEDGVFGGKIDKKMFIVLPYVKNITDSLKDTMDSNITLGYRCLNCLDRIIRTHKGTNKKDEKFYVVYKISCKDCNASYVGQTKRQLQTRLKEHKYNIRLDSDKQSVVSEHICNFGHA